MLIQQNLEIYLDYATIPSLAYFMHFIQHKDDVDSIRLFGLARFDIPQSIIDRYPANHLFYHNIDNRDLTAVLNQLADILAQENKRFQINLHLNLFHSIDLFFAIYPIYQQYQHKISTIQLQLYDDGSEGIVTQHSLCKIADLEQLILQHKNVLLELLTKGTANVPNPTLLRYLWNNIIDSQFHLISDHFLQHPKLQPLKRLLKRYTILDFTCYPRFNAEQKQLLKEILHISNELENLLKLLKQHNTFLFTGTTAFNLDQEKLDLLTQLHILLLNEHQNPHSTHYIGNNYLLLIKGHANSPALNHTLALHFPDAIFLPANIPFEIFAMLGFTPNKMGGFASTSYINYPTENINHLFFLTSDQPSIRTKWLDYEKQFGLMYSLLAMQKINEDQAFMCTIHN
ncbi:hypothetical protein A6046_03050 [[Haemophilus] ducreyi]|uniref:Sialyltransferase PMO188 n=1 Tax=Haemophilus ducreyi TaxID=730 RepID=A0AAC8UB07_HAEDC|nr:hypothetical protein [[Haemophilus] ducreyi]AKO30250.1 hypothetical protein RY60_00200 [[Haemophilus] ducreyi]AKO31684.1 hypothetical protein RZ57_00205 [[Haemophilus] ducreyi]AKO33135.1 hypothetical protein RZ58_00200 [[Haemophilus] ducreyi]AKO34585.1 hypothetical protein RZ59_00200 [[Haemophilus] ducreyi]AKO36020.1 hypothetical protein RZ61_00210 [[Haemophilus] ducreyi]